MSELTKILVTGGAGFVGCALATELARRDRTHIVVVDNFSRGRRDPDLETLLAAPNVDLLEVDLTDPHQVAQLPADVHYVYHLAALIGVKHVTKTPDQVFRVNLLSVINLFEHLRRAPALRRVLFSSTSEVYAGTLRHHGMAVPTPESTPLTIDNLADARTSYALTKIAGEAIGLQYGKTHGLPVTNVRFHNVYGPRMGFAHVIPETIGKIAETSEIAVPSAGHTRAFCYIADAVHATIACAESDRTAFETINIGNADEEIAIRDLVRTLAATMGKDIQIRELPATPGSPERRCPDVSKLIALTGCRPRVSLADGLNATYRWYKDRLGARYE